MSLSTCFHPVHELRLGVRRVAASATWLATRSRRRDVSLFHEFAPPPAGGGHQFLRALQLEFERRGLAVENNVISGRTPVCLFNSFNFDFARLRVFRRTDCRMVHRVDGPIGVYRGVDDGTDRRIFELNRELATATVFQSRFSLRKHQELGFEFRAPVVIPNAPDPGIFNPAGRRPFCRDRKTRLISVSWSDNANKGATTYKWIDEHLDWSRFDYTFIGRSAIAFRNIAMKAPVTSEALAQELRQGDIYVTASRNDPCSNSLLEALACGLPALYLNSGGHAEIAGAAGLPFEDEEQIPGLLDQLVAEYASRQAAISLPSIASVADRYLAAMERV